jgi:hypothetical protein
MTARRVLTRLKLSLVLCVALVGTAAVLIGNAAAAPGDGIPFGQRIHEPIETNVPLLAWRGEQLRFVKCEDNDVIETGAVVLPNEPLSGASNARANIWVEDFSAPNNADGTHQPWPQPVSGTFRVVRGIEEGENCVVGDFMSVKAGLAQIKLVVTNSSGRKVLEHQFLAGWMSINSAVMTNAGPVTDLPGEEPGNSANVQVTGRIPLNSEFQEDWGLPAALVLPDQWATLAESGIASTSTELRQDNPRTEPSQYWDIHDSSGPAQVNGDGGLPDIHVPGYCLTPTPTSTTDDQVDNCRGLGSGHSGWQFSRIFGDFGLGVGPFDPNYDQTLLSDGKLNAADAPLPPLRIDFWNSGPFGFFTNSSLSDKHVVYSRDGLGTNSAHNLYAPYYSTYIPGSQRSHETGSGTNGPHGDETGGNNFEGYLVHGTYHYWDIADTLLSAEGGDSPCLLRTDEASTFRPLNSGPQRVALYTDEHGEVRVTWQPGLGNDNFGTTVGFVDDDGGCDLEGVDLGTSTISALARYPFQNVANPTTVTGTIAKSLENRFQKTISCVRKNNASRAIVYICTASARDIAGNGNVFNGEIVCFVREPDLSWFAIGGEDLGNPACVRLGGGTATLPATASVETPATLVGSFVNVSAHFLGEKLWRDACIVVGQPASVPGPCGGTGGTTTGGTTTGGTTTGGTTTGGTTTGGLPGGSITSLRPGAQKAKVRASVASVQLVATPRGRVLKVRIFSASKTARIQIRLINAKGRVIAIVTRTVKTNKLVLVPNLRVAKNVKSVRVRVLS